MADESQVLRAIDWREVFPFTHLFRAFRIAIHPSKLVLGLLLILTIYVGGRFLDAIWPSGSLPTPYEVQTYEVLRWTHATPEQMNAVRQLIRRDIPASLMQRWDYPLAVEEHPDDKVQKRGIFDEFSAYETAQVSMILQSALANRWLGGIEVGQDLTPFPSVVTGITNLLIIGPGWLVSGHPVYSILFAIVFLVSWALFGGAIARIAAVHVARDEKISVRHAITFSANKILSFVFAPLIPLIIILLFGLLVAAGGLLFYVPWIGPIIAGGLFILAIVAGVIMTLAATGMIGGLNLMYPTVAVEGSDSFDAISRSFSYIFARPWRMLFYSAVSLVYGALCYLFVRWFVYAVLSLTHYFAGWWLWSQPGKYFPDIWPTPDITSLVYSPRWDHLKWSESLSAGLICFWIYLLISLLGSYLISFYFSVNTIVYYLMRQEVDATELDDVYVEETEEEFVDAPGAPKAAASTTTVATETGPVMLVPVSEATSTPAPSAAPETPSQVENLPPSAPPPAL